MKFVHKIIILIILQILIIITSFLIVAYLESQKILAGHMINTAGKNRVLASQVEIELHRLVLDEHTQSMHGITDTDVTMTGIFNALTNLKENINILKQGGKVSDIVITPIPAQFDDDWQNVSNVFTLYYDSITLLEQEETITTQSVEDAIRIGGELIVFSDILTENMSKELETYSFQMVTLQILLGIINVGIHIIMIWLILRILNRYAKEKTEKEKFIVLGEFASILAHDIRNPLGTIYNSIQLISKNIHDEKNKKEVNRINRSINRMSNQIEGILNYVKVPALYLNTHSLTEMLNDCIEDIRIPNNIKLTLPENDTTIYCDGRKMEFVFTNLIINAIQAIGDEKGRIKIDKKEGLKQITIFITNTGSDIPKEYLEKVFDPLFTTNKQGTGLGLTSCRNIIVAHGGTISVTNNPVTFMITLPEDKGGVLK